MVPFIRFVKLIAAALVVVFVPLLIGSVRSQELPQSFLKAPIDSSAAPGSRDSRSLDSILFTPQLFQGILPMIPNLEIGYLYNFGDSVGSGRLTADYQLPITMGNDGAVFGEAHFEFQDFWKTVQGASSTRTDVSVGGGYRRMFGNDLMVGVNAFYDSTCLGEQSLSSMGFGLEMAALIEGHDAADLNFNWYGYPRNDILSSIISAGTDNYNLEAGYSHELYEGGPDLRLKVTGYRFGAPERIYGFRAGAELTSRNGMLSVKYEGGRDWSTGTYHTIGGYMSVGLQLENLVNGESPFVAPEPVFKSPRNVRRLLTSKVRRMWTGLECGGCDGYAMYGPQVIPEAQPLYTSPSIR